MTIIERLLDEHAEALCRALIARDEALRELVEAEYEYVETAEGTTECYEASARLDLAWDVARRAMQTDEGGSEQDAGRTA